jgi:hypothetical protein
VTIIVAYHEGVPEYRSAGGPGASEAERQKAQELDELLKARLAQLYSRLVAQKKLSKDGKGDVEVYWAFGAEIRNIFEGSGLVNPRERAYFHMAVRLHAHKSFLGKDRSPSRGHVAYCFRLGGFPQQRALALNWGEWVTLFDSAGINAEARFDHWLQHQMGEGGSLTRQKVRLLASCINSMLGKVETRDLSDDELYRAFDGAWRLSERLQGERLRQKSRDASGQP